MTHEPGAESPPPGWARTPSAFRARGNASFPLAGAAGLPPRLDAGTPSLRDSLGRMATSIRLTALLLFAAPLLDLFAVVHPPTPADAIWQLAIAQSLPSALMMPALGALLLAILAVARPGPVPTVLAFASCAVGIALAGLSIGVLAGETLPYPARSPAFATHTSSILRGALTVAVFVAVGWGVYHHGHLRGGARGGAALPRPRPPGIDILD